MYKSRAGHRGAGRGVGTGRRVANDAPFTFRERIAVSLLVIFYCAAAWVLLIALASAVLASPRSDQYAVEPHPYRGYAQICVLPAGEQAAQCGLFQTEQVWDTRQECERALVSALEALRRELLEALPGAQVGGRYECAYDRSQYNA